MNEKQSLPYAAALQYEIPVFNFYRNGMAVKNFTYTGNGPAFVNAWIFRNQRPHGFFYTFYLQGDYVFETHCAEGTWVVCVGDKLYPQGIDHHFVRRVFEEIGREPVLTDKPAPAPTVEFPWSLVTRADNTTGTGYLQRPGLYSNVMLRSGLPIQTIQFSASF